MDRYTLPITTHYRAWKVKGHKLVALIYLTPNSDLLVPKMIGTIVPIGVFKDQTSTTEVEALIPFSNYFSYQMPEDDIVRDLLIAVGLNPSVANPLIKYQKMAV